MVLAGFTLSASACAPVTDTATSAKSCLWSFGTEKIDSLYGPQNTPLVAPDVAVHAGADFLVNDRSNKQIFKYSSGGRGDVLITGVRLTEPRFLSGHVTLLSKNSVSVFDANDGVVHHYSVNGLHLATDSTTFANRAPPRNLRLLDDSLVLVTRSIVGNERNPLLEVRSMDFALRTELHKRKGFLSDLPVLLSGMMVVRADGIDGTIFVASTGDDSLFAFDYRGRGITAGRIQSPQVSVASWKQKVQQNGGNLLGEDGEFVAVDEWSITEVVAIDASNVAIYLQRPLASGKRLRDMNDPGLLLIVNTGGGKPRVIDSKQIVGTLVGRAPLSSHGVIVLRTSESSFELVERVVLTIMPKAGVGEC
jgi:hypothetical protein